MLTTTLTKTYTDKPHESVPCPLCPGLPLKDFALATKGYPGIPVRNVICTRCGLIRIDPRMTRKGYEDFYKEDFFEYLNPYGRPAYVETIERTTDDTFETPIERFILPYILPYIPQGARVLDVGSGFGQLLYLLERKKGITYVGIEPDPFSRQVAKEKMGVDLIDTTAEEYLATTHEPFDFIFLDQVFEHLLSPLETLRQLGELLTKEGVIYVGVPNAWNPQVLMQDFYQLAHTYNYTPATLARFASVAGLKVVSLRDDESAALEMILARPESSHPAESSDRLRAGADWRATAFRLKRKEALNAVRGSAKRTLEAVLGPRAKEWVRSTLDRLMGYRY